jgi:hypothetical protein
MPAFLLRIVFPSLLAFAWAGAVDAPAAAAPAAPATEVSPAPGPASAAPASGPAATSDSSAKPAAKAHKGGSKAAKAAPKGAGAVVITVGPNKIRRSQIDTLAEMMVKARHQDGSSPQPGELLLIE